MPTFTLMCGLPGSGKSTYANKAAGLAPDTRIISCDAHIEAFALEMDLSYAEAFRIARDEARWLAFQEAFAAIERGESFIWDLVNLTPEDRKLIRDIVPPGYTCSVIALELPEDLLAERLARRAAETGKDIPAWRIEEMRRSYIRPSLDEGFSRIDIISESGLRRLIAHSA